MVITPVELFYFVVADQEANRTYRDRKFVGCVLVSDNESWIGTGRYGSTGVMTAWQDFVKNQVASTAGLRRPELVCIDLQPYGSTRAPSVRTS